MTHPSRDTKGDPGTVEHAPRPGHLEVKCDVSRFFTPPYQYGSAGKRKGQKEARLHGQGDRTIAR